MFYNKLALHNLRKNHRAYLPFLLSMLFLVAVNTMTQVIVTNEGMKALHDSASAIGMFKFGNIIIVFFSVIFSLYTNSFLLKQRKKEFGLYNVLGLGKREIYQLMFWENTLSFLLVLSAGIVTGLILAKLGFLVLKKLMGAVTAFTFSFSVSSLFTVLLLFFLIFLFIFLVNCFQIKRMNPIELLLGNKKGEKEPKAKWFATFIGLICLGLGYYFALTIQSPIAAIGMFFVAVILVIIGTYCLFTSGSITLLKILKKNKKYYYQANHFITISNMIYRMKQNAVGLASICILATMVLVTITTTASLYIGKEDSLKNRYTHDISLTINEDPALYKKIVAETADQAGIKLKEMPEVLSSQPLLFFNNKENYQVINNNKNATAKAAKNAMIQLFSLAEYTKLSGNSTSLAANEVLVFPVNGTIKGKTLILNSDRYVIKKTVKKFGDFTAQDGLTDNFLVVMKDWQSINSLLDKWYDGTGYEFYKAKSYQLDFDFSDSSKQMRLDFVAAVKTKLAQQFSDENYNVDSKDEFEESNNTLTGGFLFLGIIFGLIFIVATSLIIYYKQISEGIDDQARFEILQKVGMSHIAVKKVIHSQVLFVFLFPLAVAILHLAVAFSMIRKLLLLFGLLNWQLFLVTTIIVVLIFSLLYLIVYQLTARSYYQIVERKN